MARMKFMNTEIDNLTMQETLQAIDQLIQEKKSHYMWKEQTNFQPVSIATKAVNYRSRLLFFSSISSTFFIL